MEDDFNLIQLVEVCGPTESILVRPGEFLFREDDEAQSLYIVKKGNLRIMSGSVVSESITAGGVVEEMALIDDGAPRSASVLAGSHTELWEIDTDTFRSMVATEPEFRTHGHAGHGAPPPYHESAVSPDGIRLTGDLPLPEGPFVKSTLRSLLGIRNFRVAKPKAISADKRLPA